MAAFEWDGSKEEAALLIAVGELTNDEIAEKLDIGIATLYRWKTYQEFKDKIRENKDQIRSDLFDFQFANVAHRIVRANKRLKDLGRLTDARAEANADLTGGKTGLVVRDYKGSGENIREVSTFDAALIKEERELMKYISQELGQWTEKTELSGSISTDPPQQQLEDILKDLKVKALTKDKNLSEQQLEEVRALVDKMAEDA